MVPAYEPRDGWNMVERPEGMRMSKAFRFALVVASAATLLVGLSTAASAAPTPSGLVTVTQAFASSGVEQVTLDCPAGDRLVGSGGGGYAQLLAEAPTGNYTGAKIAVAFQTSPTGFAYVQIICAPTSQFSDVIVSETRDHGTRAGQFSQDVGRCPAGYYAFGGGGYFSSSGTGFMPSGSNNVTNAPSADGNGWTFAGVAPQGADTMEIHIECAPRTGHDTLVQFGNISTNANTAVSSYADCPSGYTAVAGGFYISNPNGSPATPGSAVWTVPTSHSAGISSWYASGYAPVGTKMVALAQCLR
jgi:hypothetical protein